VKRGLSQDVWVLIFLVAFIIILGIVASRWESSQTTDVYNIRRTTYAAGKHGLKALYETLKELDYRVSRQLTDLTVQPEDGVMFIVSPITALSKEEWNSLHNWVQKGNLLILASDENFVPDPTGNVEVMSSRPCIPSFLSPDVTSYCTEKSASTEITTFEFSQGAVSTSGFG